MPLRVILVKALSAEKDVLLATFEGLLSQFYAVFFFFFFFIKIISFPGISYHALTYPPRDENVVIYYVDE